MVEPTQCQVYTSVELMSNCNISAISAPTRLSHETAPSWILSTTDAIQDRGAGEQMIVALNCSMGWKFHAETLGWGDRDKRCTAYVCNDQYNSVGCSFRLV